MNLRLGKYKILLLIKFNLYLCQLNLTSLRVQVHPHHILISRLEDSKEKQ